MEPGERRRRYLLYGSVTAAALTGLVAVVVTNGVSLFGQSLTVFGFAPTLQAGIAVLFVLNIVIIMKVTFGGYTDRTTEVALTDPQGIMRTGLNSAVLVLSPYVVLAAGVVHMGAGGTGSPAPPAGLAAPPGGVNPTPAPGGGVHIGRKASGRGGGGVGGRAAGAGQGRGVPVPFGIVGIGVTVLGFGAIVWDMRYGESKFESQDRETYGKQHRYL